ncbi:MAG: DUF5667 domain-containing protein [Patescibacteria group bacterium]
MKKSVLAILVALLACILFGVWFWTLGSIPDVETGSVTLRVDAPGVEIRKSGSERWDAADSGTSLSASDSIRTDATGRATILFFGRGEARLYEDTEMKIEDLSAGATTPIRMRLELATGRVWSRVIRLFNLDSSYSVRTDSVVSTVRGTAFDVIIDERGSSIVQVADAAVDVEANWNGDPESWIVTEGSKVLVNPDSAGPVESLSADDTSSEWYKRNVDTDDAFLGRTSEGIAASYERRGRVRPDQALYSLKMQSERLHLALAGKGAPQLLSSYLGRRLYGIKTLVDEGKSGLAFQAFNRLEQDVQDALPTPAASGTIPHLRIEVENMLLLTQGVMPSSPLYRFKLKLEDLSQSLAESDEAQALFSRLLSADSRMDEAEGLIGAMQLEEASLSLEAAHQGIENGKRDADRIVPTTTPERGKAIRSKLRALEAREALLRARLATAERPTTEELGATTSTEAGATSTQPLTTDETPSETGSPAGTVPADTTPPPATEKPVVEAPWDRIVLTAQPNPVDVGSIAQLRLTGTRSDGSTGDLTPRATFRLFGNIGSLNGPTFTSTAPGSVTIEATVMDNGTAKTARTVLQVNQAVTLSRLGVSASGPTTVLQGGTVPLIATATYSSGLTAPVTSKTVWTSSDASIGTISGTSFVASANGLGPVTVTGTYTEGSITKYGTVTFMVTAPSAVGR